MMYNYFNENSQFILKYYVQKKIIELILSDFFNKEQVLKIYQCYLDNFKYIYEEKKVGRYVMTLILQIKMHVKL